MKKLFNVVILNDCDFFNELYIGESSEQIENDIWGKYNNGLDTPYSCLMSVSANEIKEIDGYRVILEKIE